MKLVIVILCLPFLCLAQKENSTKKDSIKKGQFIVLPNLAYSPETSLGLGLATFYNNTWKQTVEKNKISSHSFYFLYTLKKQMNIGGDSDNWLNNNKTHFYTKIDYYDYPYDYYSLGGNSSDTSEKYTSKYFKGLLLFEKSIAKNWYLGGQIETRIETPTTHIPKKEGEKDVFLMKNSKGTEGFKVFGIAPTLTYDSRNNVLYPTKGDLHALKIRHFNKGLSDQESFTLYEMDLRRYITLNSKNHILALNFKYLFTDNNNIPFQMLPAVGGDKIQRGYYDGRFKHTNQMVFQTDYRFPITKRIKGVVFGSVSAVSSSFSLKNPHPAAGVGVRYRLGNDGMHIRIDFAYGNTFSPYINVNEAF